MEKKFCSQCGKSVTECTCGASNGRVSAGFGGNAADKEKAGKSGEYYIREFDNIALIDGEEVVRKYHIGEFAKGTGSGRAEIIITNKRVISKQDSNYLGSSSTSVEEITLESISGVKNFFYQGYTIWRLVVAAIAALMGLLMLVSGGRTTGIIFGLVLLGVAVFMGITSRKPSYLFSIYSSASSTAMEMGVNLRGKVFNSQGNGIVFQYKPTKQAVTMMCEIGACVVDLKNKGNYAIEAWKNRRY